MVLENFGAVTKLRMDSSRAMTEGGFGPEVLGKRRRRGKPSQPYRLGLLEGVSASPFFFGFSGA
jgi:hypothetical protein